MKSFLNIKMVNIYAVLLNIELLDILTVYVSPQASAVAAQFLVSRKSIMRRPVEVLLV